MNSMNLERHLRSREYEARMLSVMPLENHPDAELNKTAIYEKAAIIIAAQYYTFLNAEQVKADAKAQMAFDNFLCTFKLVQISLEESPFKLFLDELAKQMERVAAAHTALTLLQTLASKKAN